MSADDMLAAQLWPWPDPIIKRNAQGGVVFVNAAFLQAYGGQVADWHGCAVEGWPAPMGGHVPNRFETRMPSASGEIIYDWLEYVMPDGGALAISRNITALLNQTPPPLDPYQASVPHIDPNSVEAHMQTAQPYQAESSDTPVAIHHAADPHVIGTAPELDIAPDIDLNSAPEIPQTQIPTADMPVEQTADTAPEPAPEPIEPAEPVSTISEPQERDFERRALPIENEENILGHNWRDAVIAKAVGADEKDMSSTSGVQDNTAIEESPIAAPQSPLIAGANNQDGALKILLAEDNAINALLTRTLLEADGYHVEVVEDGSLAVDAVRANQYDMILMDMRMPNMDGLEATRKIRSLSNAGKSIPIIALTANAFDDDRNACFDAGMNDFMTKPVSAEELQQMVQTWTKSRETVAA